MIQDTAGSGQLAGGHVDVEADGVVGDQGTVAQLQAAERERLGVGLEVRERAELQQTGGVVVDLPRDAGCTEPLGHGLPGERAVVGLPVDYQGLHDGAAMGAGRVDARRDRHHPVGVGGAEYGAVVAVADRERIGQGVVEGQVGVVEVPHRHRTVLDAVPRQVSLDEVVHGPAVPALVLGCPVVGEAGQTAGGTAAGSWSGRDPSPGGSRTDRTPGSWCRPRPGGPPTGRRTPGPPNRVPK